MSGHIPWFPLYGLLLNPQTVLPENIFPADAIHLASELRGQGKLAEAETTLSKALESLGKSGPEGVQSAMILNNLATVYQDLDRYAKAEECLQRALRVWERVCGQDGLCLVRPLVNLASHYIKYGQLSKADRVGRRLLRIRVEGLGPDNPEVPMLFRHLAKIYYARGRYSEAEPLLQRALEMLERIGNSGDCSALAHALHDLAAIYTQTGRYAEALSHFGRALAIWEEASDSKNLARGLKNLAVLYGMTGRRAEAEAVFMRALALAESSFGPTDPFMEEILSDYAFLLRKMGRATAAKELETRAQTIREEHVPRDDLSTVDINALRAGKRK